MVASFPHQPNMTTAIAGFTVEISHDSPEVGFLTCLSLFHADWASLVPVTVGWGMLHVDWLRPTWFPLSSWSNVYSPKPQWGTVEEAWGDTTVPTGLCKCLPKETIISVSAGLTLLHLGVPPHSEPSMVFGARETSLNIP